MLILGIGVILIIIIFVTVNENKKLHEENKEEIQRNNNLNLDLKKVTNEKQKVEAENIYLKVEKKKIEDENKKLYERQKEYSNELGKMRYLEEEYKETKAYNTYLARELEEIRLKKDELIEKNNNLDKQLNIISKEKEELSLKYKNLKVENEKLKNEEELKKIQLENDIEIAKKDKAHKRKLEKIEAETKQKEIDQQLKIELSQYKINSTMNKIFEEYTEKRLMKFENFFRTKKNPSMKSAEYIKEIKEEYKQLESENRKYSLILSEFFDEEENTKEEMEANSFESEDEAYKYGKVEKEVWNNLSYIEKLDVVLERYKNTWKNKLNIGLEFERYCGYLYEKKGYQVKYHGILNGKADGGIDLIAKNKKETIYIQCKYWGNNKLIRENTISQLFGSALKMALDNGESYESFIQKIIENKISILLLTKTAISEEAKMFCEKLKVKYKESIEIDSEYPRVKLVYGEERIFYIPTDLQYDNINFGSTNKDYARAYSCKEAENLGYRHCFKWLGNRE